MSEARRFQAPLGTEDILPERIPLWRRLEETARRAAERFGYQEIRTPLFEQTALFYKSTGEATDIVEKEMFTFGKGEDSLSLCPEVTPSVVRALIEHSLDKKRGFWKLFYLQPVFRHERPQKGRYRQFHQFGVEAIGSKDPRVDVETIVLYTEFLKDLGVTKYETNLNSIGCGSCRGVYREVLREAIRPNLPKHCENCRRRFERNVFRILDCKIQQCIDLTRNLPAVMDHVCADCKAHFGAVESGLKAAGVAYRVNPRIVRGLDYYTRTVYEFTSPLLGAQDAIAAGGRYDSLVAGMGGPDLASVGWASGLERLILVLDAMGVNVPPSGSDFYIVSVQDGGREACFEIANELRRAGLSGDLDLEGRSLKAQFRSADRSGARFALVVGPDELARGGVKVKEMATGAEREVLRKDLVSALKGGSP